MDHGTRARYNRGCRCKPCTAANADYIQRYRANGKQTLKPKEE